MSVGIEVCVVIPTYRPGIELVEHVQHLRSQGDYPIVVSDDASPVTADPVLRAVGEIDGVEVIRHFRNAGIARGLNDGVARAVSVGARWLLTLDQDSVVGAGFIEKLLASVRESSSLWSEGPRVGVIAPATISDASGEISYPSRGPLPETGDLVVTEEVIQSGALWNVAALMHATGSHGFDEHLGIDAVDAAACLRLREAGYLIALAPEVTLTHNLGDSRQVSVLGRTIMVTNHSPARRATMVRNRLKLAPAEFKQSPKHAFRSLRRVAVNTAFGAIRGEDRWEKTKASFSGLKAKKKE